MTSKYLGNAYYKERITKYGKLRMENLQNSLSPLALQEINTERKHYGPSSFDTGPAHRHVLLPSKPQRPRCAGFIVLGSSHAPQTPVPPGETALTCHSPRG